MQFTTTRRDFIALMSAAGITGLGPTRSLAQEQMPTRPIPGTGERLPVIGLGSSKAVSQVSTAGTEPAKRPRNAEPASIAPEPTASGTCLSL